MTERRAYYAVDRLEGDVVVLVGDDRAAVDVARRQLPVVVREGDLLSVRLDASGRPDWATAAQDPDERDRRLAEARARLERLRKRDPGGDIRL